MKVGIQKRSLPYNPWIWAMSVLIAVSIFLFLFQLGAKPFWDYDEAIYANVIVDTLHNGEFLTLNSSGAPWFQKPPLYFWTSMGIDSLFHDPEFSYRLTAALAAIASIVLTMLVTYELTGSYPAAFVSGIVLLTTGAFFEAGRELRLDVPATMGNLFSVYSFLRGQKDKRWYIGVGVGFGIGFFFKTVIGLFSIFFLLTWSLVYRDLRWLKNIYIWIGGAAFLLLIAPWHLYESFRYGNTFWQEYLLTNTIGRLANDLQLQSVSNSDYFNFFLTYGAPWTILFLFFVVWLTIRIKDIRTQTMKPLFVCTLTTLLMLLVFVLAKTKILTYLVPSYPYVATTLAVGFWYLFSKYEHRKNIKTTSTAVFGMLVALGLWITINYGFHIFPYIAVNDLLTFPYQLNIMCSP